MTHSEIQLRAAVLLLSLFSTPSIVWILKRRSAGSPFLREDSGMSILERHDFVKFLRFYKKTGDGQYKESTDIIASAKPFWERLPDSSSRFDKNRGWALISCRWQRGLPYSPLSPQLLSDSSTYVWGWESRVNYFNRQFTSLRVQTKIVWNVSQLCAHHPVHLHASALFVLTSVAALREQSFYFFLPFYL